MESTTEVIVLTGQGTIENAVQATKLGAYDYLTKPCQLTELCVLLQKALGEKAVKPGKCSPQAVSKRRLRNSRDGR